MEDLILYFKMGFTHVLDLAAYDHILFLIVLAVVFSIKEWIKVLWLVTLFTLGHSITLALAAYKVLEFPIDIIEFLIPLTIFITGFVNVITTKKTSTKSNRLNLFFAFFFGFIHGLGFSNYFKMMIGQEQNKFLPLLEFALGIEGAQIIIVLSILIIGFILQSFLKTSKRDWVLVTSSIVIGFAIQMMLERIFW
ncbi:HupE/UreJ family protein [Polaribacter sp.]|uniref:HupE/UreJ family protein n=1 Tax=Polaribacter sp. TaxID=1920175 RepID=UPI003F69935A